MNVPAKLAGFAVALLAVFAVGAGIGAAVGPAPARHETGEPAPLGNGVVSSEAGYRIEVRTPLAATGGPFRFVVLDRDGAPVTGFTPLHDRDLHLVVVNRELTDYHHLHPTLGADGTWSVDVPPVAPGSYRAIADFVVAGGPRLALGTDLAVGGAYQPRVAPEPAPAASVDGYDVTLDSTQGDGGVNTFVFTIHADGRPVSDLQPYLGADGHLVALRAGDLAYSHVHPLESSDGTVRFEATLPSPGRYRLFLDFQHAGTVHTASFTFDQGAVTGAAPEMSH